MQNSYLCLSCSLSYTPIAIYRNQIRTASYTDANYIHQHGKHLTGWVTSALNGVLLKNDSIHYESLMSVTAQSGFIEIERQRQGELDNFNLYQQFAEPQADMRVYGSSIGVSPLFKVVDIKNIGKEHGFGVTGCREIKGECHDCGIPLFDHSSGSPLSTYSM